MSHIHHRIAIKAAPERVYAALTTLEGLSAWWSQTAKGSPQQGGTIEFRFGDRGPDARVVEATLNRRVAWLVTGGIEEWTGTTISFELEPNGEYTGVRFRQSDWKSEEKAFGHCSAKWAVFLLSLKQLVERGEGTPYPRESKIDEYN